MKTSQIIVLAMLLFVAGITIDLATRDYGTIRSHHRLTPRLELIIDSGRVDTVFIYKAEGK